MDAKGDALLIDGQRIAFHRERDPTKIPWGRAAEGGADVYVLECSGVFADGAAAAGHLGGGAKKVIISAPAKDAQTPVLVMGVNHASYDAKARGDAAALCDCGRCSACMRVTCAARGAQSHHVVSNASCTTNCVAPLAKARSAAAHCIPSASAGQRLPAPSLQVVDDAFGIEQALMSTVHAVTASQKVVDAPTGGKHDWRAGRSALNNIIPASTGAATAVTKALPHLRGKIDGCAFRVPVTDVSLVDLSVRTARPASLEQVTAAMREAAAGPMRGILAVADAPCVSSDFVGDSASCVFDARASMALGDRMFKLVAWCVWLCAESLCFTAMLTRCMLHARQVRQRVGVRAALRGAGGAHGEL